MANKSYLDKTGLTYYDEETKKRTAIFRGSISLGGHPIIAGSNYSLEHFYKVGSNSLAFFYLRRKNEKRC